jgi:hypothetical protein
VHLTAYFDDVAAAGPQRILNMPSGMMGGKSITDVDRSASRFRARSSSGEAQADACTMLAIIAERLEGPPAAVAHFEKGIALSTNDTQKAEVHINLARTYGVMGEEEKRAEQLSLASGLKEKVAAAEAEERRKKAEEAEKERAAEGAAEDVPPKSIPGLDMTDGDGDGDGDDDQKVKGAAGSGPAS